MFENAVLGAQNQYPCPASTDAFRGWIALQQRPFRLMKKCVLVAYMGFIVLAILVQVYANQFYLSSFAVLVLAAIFSINWLPGSQGGARAEEACIDYQYRYGVLSIVFVLLGCVYGIRHCSDGYLFDWVYHQLSTSFEANAWSNSPVLNWGADSKNLTTLKLASMFVTALIATVGCGLSFLAVLLVSGDFIPINSVWLGYALTPVGAAAFLIEGVERVLMLGERGGWGIVKPPFVMEFVLLSASVWSLYLVFRVAVSWNGKFKSYLQFLMFSAGVIGFNFIY